MKLQVLESLIVVVCCLLPIAASLCDEPSPAFPPPKLDASNPRLEVAARSIQAAIQNLTSRSEYDNTSFSVAVTSSVDVLFEFHHTAKHRSAERKGAAKIDNTTNYRIASMTKPFTVLAILKLHKAGLISLDDPVSRYLPELSGPQNGSLPWKDITLRALASQIAGIPRDFAQSDFAARPDIAAGLGLPPSSTHGLPQCDAIVGYNRTCTGDDLIQWVKLLQPLYAPNQKSSYSNINYDLLGLVISKTTGVSYEEHIEAKILRDLEMRGSGFQTPNDSVAAIPAGQEGYWGIEMGANNPTGGMYSSTGDLGKFLRFVLTSYNAQTSALNWFQPTSWSDSSQTYYGIPWEIFRSKPLEGSSRPVTFITKGGGLPGYTSNMIMAPEYGFGVSVLVAGKASAMEILRDIAVSEVLKASDELAHEELKTRYAGHFAAHPSNKQNSSLTIESSAKHGLTITRWISHGKDTLAAVKGLLYDEATLAKEQILSVVPTELYVNEKEQQGERWRVRFQMPSATKDPLVTGLFDNFCVSDLDIAVYGGKPLNEVVFWAGKAKASADRITLTAFDMELYREDNHDHAAETVAQTPLLELR